MNQVILVQEEPISCFEIIETSVAPTAGGQFTIQLPDSQQLRSDTDQTIVVKAIRVTVPGKLAFGPVTGLPIAPVAELQKISLTLYSQGWQRGHNMPLLNFNDVVVPAGVEPYRYTSTRLNDWKKIDWPKSYFLYSNGSGGAAPGATGYCIMLEVEYVRLTAQGVIMEGPNP